MENVKCYWEAWRARLKLQISAEIWERVFKQHSKNATFEWVPRKLSWGNPEIWQGLVHYKIACRYAYCISSLEKLLWWGNPEMWQGEVHYKTAYPPPPRSFPSRDLFQLARFIDDPSSQLITLAPLHKLILSWRICSHPQMTVQNIARNFGNRFISTAKRCS